MNDTTKRFFRQTGIPEGMTVLDIRCGKGVTTEIVGKIEKCDFLGFNYSNNS